MSSRTNVRDPSLTSIRVSDKVPNLFSTNKGSLASRRDDIGRWIFTESTETFLDYHAEKGLGVTVEVVIARNGVAVTWQSRKLSVKLGVKFPSFKEGWQP